MEEELSFLRRKVNRLEDMIYNLNDKISLVLEKYFTRRAGQVGSMRNVLQEEEDICLSLVTQLKSCIVTGTVSASASTGASGNPSGSSINVSSKTSPPPRWGLSKPTHDSGRTTRSSAAATTRFGGVDRYNQAAQDQFEINIEQDPLTPTVEADTGADDPNMFEVNLKAEPVDEEMEIQDQLGLQDDQELDDGGQAEFEDPGDEFSDDDVEELESKSKPKKKLQRDPDPDFLIIKPRKRIWKSKHVRKRPLKTYTKQRTFATEEEARALIRSERQFEIDSTRYTAKGKKVYYTCKADPKCPVNIHLLIDEGTGTADEFVCTDPSEHVHRQRLVLPSNSNRGLPDEVKRAVEDIYIGFGGPTASTKTLDQVHRQLSQKGFPGVAKHALHNYINTLKKRMYGDLSFMRSTPKAAAGGAGPDKKSKNRDAGFVNVNTPAPTPAPMNLASSSTAVQDQDPHQTSISLISTPKPTDTNR